MPRVSARFLIFITVTIVLIAAIAVALDFLPALLQVPRVLSITPADGTLDVLPNSPITITFSAPMDKAQTVESIRLEPGVGGNFVWQDDQTLIFSPRTRLPIATSVSIGISQGARSWLGRPMADEMVAQFTTLARPTVVASTPPLDARFLYLPNRVTLTFNRPMDPDSLANLHIEPPLEHFAVEVQDSTLVISGWFQPRTRYQITLPSSAQDAEYGIELENELAWGFTTGLQYPNFSILNRERVLKLPAGEPLRLPTQFTNVSRLDLALYSIPVEEFDTNAAAPFETWYPYRPTGAPIQTQSVATNAVLDEYMRQEIVVDALESGTYYLSVTTPEGVEDRMLVEVE